MPFKEGEEVGPYRIMEQLGRGGMATVFKAYHASLDRYVALKVLHPAFMEDPNFLARFQREARVVAKLEHPNIIPVYDFAEHENRTYLVMKYVEGQTLKGRLNQSALSPGEGVEIIKEMGKALTYAHNQDVLHRDIKPSNVMIANDGQIYLTDFGLARIASAGESTLSSDMMIGTPQYISPEQAMGQRNLDAGTDIYSFGVLIYELVVGQVPYSSDTPFSIVHDHIYKPLPLPRTVNPNVPETMERVLLKALAKEREHRFTTIEELVTAFESAARGQDMPTEWADPKLQQSAVSPVPTPLPAAAVLTPPPTKRKRRWWPIAVVMMLCICSFLAIGILNDGNQDGFATSIQATRTAEALLSVDETDGDGADAAAEADTLPPDIQRALTAVETSPENERAYLNLAAAYLDNDQSEAAEEALREGATHADDLADYNKLAGDILLTREHWVAAAERYIAAWRGGYDVAADDTFQSRLEQATFRASAEPEAEPILFEQANDEQALVYVGRARFFLYVGNDLDLAEENINIALELDPDLNLAYLVQAEYYIAVGEWDAAIELLDALVDNESLDPWMRLAAEKTRSEIIP